MIDHRTNTAMKRRIQSLEDAVENLSASVASQNRIVLDLRNSLHAEGLPAYVGAVEGKRL